MNDVLTRKIKTLAKQAWMEASGYHKTSLAPLQIIEVAIHEAVLAERKRCIDYERALQAIIERSHKDPLGTSKVIDMRTIAEKALARFK